MKIFWMMVFLLGVGNIAFSQAKKTAYFIQPEAALLNGDRSASAQVKLIGGFEKNKWGFALGAGVDYYKIRTAPVFLTSHYYLNNTKRLSAYASAGINIAWALENQYTNHSGNSWWPNNKGSFSNGLYGDVGIRYAVSKKATKGFNIGIGFSVKTIAEHFTENVFIPSPGPGPVPPINVDRTFNYQFNRISLSISYKL